MHNPRRMRLIPINIAPKHQIIPHIRRRNPRNLAILPHNPHTLHPHHHMLQNMAMNHPDARIRDSEAPCAPALAGAGGGFGGVAVEVCGVAEDGGVEGEFGFVEGGVVGSVAGAAVVVVPAVGV